MHNFCEKLKEENQMLKVQLSVKQDDFRRCLKPGNHPSYELDNSHSKSFTSAEKPRPTLPRARSRSHKKKNLNKEVKKWVSSEISRLCVGDDDSSDAQIITNVDEDHPLYPLVEIIKVSVYTISFLHLILILCEHSPCPRTHWRNKMQFQNYRMVSVLILVNLCRT